MSREQKTDSGALGWIVGGKTAPGAFAEGCSDECPSELLLDRMAMGEVDDKTAAETLRQIDACPFCRRA